MAVPAGYEKIQANTLYENVEYWIDTSVTLDTGVRNIQSNITTYPYLDGRAVGSGDYGYFGVCYDAKPNSIFTIINLDTLSWLTNGINDGVVTGYPTLNINLTSSPDWLYVKSSASALYYEPLYEGSELQDSATFTPTTSQQSLTLEQGKVAVKAVTVDAVTASIDSNIQPQNIKLGVTILGVQGNLSADKPDQTKTVTPTKSTQTVTPDAGYELSSVTVNPIPSQYIEPTGSLSVTQDGTYDVTNYATVDVTVPNPLLAATDAEMTALTTEANIGKVVKFTGTTGTYQQQRLYLIKSNATLISFTIEGTSYQAEEGMTWAEWVESDYNTAGFYVNQDGTAFVRTNTGSYVNYQASSCTSSQSIVSNGAYTVSNTITGGGGD